MTLSLTIVQISKLAKSKGNFLLVCKKGCFIKKNINFCRLWAMSTHFLDMKNSSLGQT